MDIVCVPPPECQCELDHPGYFVPVRRFCRRGLQGKIHENSAFVANTWPRFTLSSSNVLEVYQQFCDVIDDITYAVPLPLHDILHHVCILSPLSADPTTLASLEQSIRDLFDDPDVSFVWSRASLIILYQRLHKVAALHPVIRTMSWDILLALDPRPCLKAEVFPLFLAGTTALLPSQRDAVRLRWVCAPEKGFEESLGFLNDLWAEMDCTGNTIDWLGYMEQRKIKLAFF